VNGWPGPPTLSTIITIAGRGGIGTIIITAIITTTTEIKFPAVRTCAAHVDEDWNMEQWGRDELALERRAVRFAELQAAAKVLRSL
jgi:chaperone required for assembly of F1-ATPase